MSEETDLGEVCYAGYVKSSGGVSLISGAPLPAWDGQDERIREAWRTGAFDVVAARPLGLKHVVTSNRLGHALAALREIAEPHDDELPRDTARNALDDDAAIRGGVALTREPPSAPELAAAMAARDEYLGELTQVRMRVGRVAASLDADALATQPSKKSQIQADAARRIREALA